MKAEQYMKRIKELHGTGYTDEQLLDERFCERLRQEVDEAKKVEDAIGILMDAANSSNRRSNLVPAIVAGLVHGHRYLQNELIQSLLEALGTYGDLPTGTFVDGRNEIAHGWCKKLRETFKDEIFWRDER